MKILKFLEQKVIFIRRKNREYSKIFIKKCNKYYEFCDLTHKGKISANKYCKIHDLFLFQNCLKLHKEIINLDIQMIPKDNFFIQRKWRNNYTDKPTGEDDLIRICFMNVNRAKLLLNISKKGSINETLKKFLLKLNCKKILLIKLILIYKNKLLDKNRKIIRRT